MFKIFKKSKRYSIFLLFSTAILGSTTASADRGDHLWGAVIGGIVGSAVIHAGYEIGCSRDIYRSHIREDLPAVYPARYRYRRDLSSLRRSFARKRMRNDYRSPSIPSQKKVKTLKKEPRPKPAPKVRALLKKFSSVQKIQRALRGLGFYQGTLDGELHSYETQTALKKFYSRYEITDTSGVMDKSLKEALVSLGELFLFDRALIDKSHTATSQIIQLQTALKIHGYYSDAIDGIMGNRTRKAIKRYLHDKGIKEDTFLDLESKYMLVKTAKQKNSAAIDRMISSFQRKEKKPYLDNTLRMQVRR